MIDLALASDGATLDLTPDDRLLRDALGARGLSTRVVPWTSESFDWAQARCCVPRTLPDAARATGSARDYDHWLGRIHELSTLAVPLQLARWNQHARYLVELGRKKVPAVATRTFAKGSEVRFLRVLDEQGAASAEIAPAHRREGPGRTFERSAARAADRHLARLIARGDVAFGFDPPCGDRGRVRSLVYVDGGFSHAVIRGDDASTLDAVLPREDEIEVARAALAAAPGEAPYARIDLRRDREDRPQLVALDVVDGPLHFGWGEGSADRLAGVLFARLASA